MDKEKQLEFISMQKDEILSRYCWMIDKYRDEYEYNNNLDIDLGIASIRLVFAESKNDIQKWKVFSMLTTSLAGEDAVGRRLKVFVYADDMIIGMLQFCSPLAILGERDKYLNLTENKFQILKGVYNIGSCLPIRKYAHLLTGKLLVYVAFSNEIRQKLESRYGDKVIGYETTSLYGKSSMYNRIPFLKFLGVSKGYSAVHISKDDWNKIKEEYFSIFPRKVEKQLAPKKYQIIDKLSNYYKKLDKPFPYEYKSTLFQRGIYFGYTIDKSLDEQVQAWRERWYFPRKERLGN